MTRAEFRRAVQLPVGVPFNFFSAAIGMWAAQLVLALFHITSWAAIIFVIGLTLLLFLIWVGLRIQFKDRLYDEYRKHVHMAVEDFLRRVREDMERRRE